jgi:hypothetical protein
MSRTRRATSGSKWQRAMLNSTSAVDTLARRTVADSSLTELLRLDGIRTKRLTIAATTRRAKLLASGVKRT